MSIKATAPKVDPETAARQKRAEARADSSRIEATQLNVSEETRAVIRQFGRLAAFSGAPSLAGAGSFQRMQIVPLQGGTPDYLGGRDDLAASIAFAYSRFR